ncbi:hypothetical protein AAFF_G00040990 [Aldrovandia affinis]|uniref:CCHC-type domain-containing protein n=1 Tax=Aldrovandia affinis TaxID=143900 RepID=A0AAD7R2R5_9TELE|nr:hypothetical protein AAFF_G00040990 [Aldrovandia affinis]
MQKPLSKCALDSVYTPTPEPHTTQSYLSDLKDLALKSGKDFTTVLEELMSQISDAVKVTEAEGPPVNPMLFPLYYVLFLEGASQEFTHKILENSGESSTSASDVIKRLGPGAVAASYIQLLDAAYDTVEDGDELMARFINTLQDSGEKNIHLPAPATSSVESSGEKRRCSHWRSRPTLIKATMQRLLGQRLLLKLEPLKDAPPSFVDLLLLLRGEEDKEASRAVRMKQHLGSARTQVATCAHSTHVCGEETRVASLQKQINELQGQFTTLISSRQEKESPNFTKTTAKKPPRQTSEPVEARVKTNRIEVSEISELRKQIADLQTQMATQRTSKRQPERAARSVGAPIQVEAADPNASERSRYGGTAANRPRPWYCFNCGEDGHIATHCGNAPNSSKVDEKKCQLRDAQAKWDLQNNVTHTFHLNRKQSPS